MNLLTKEDLKNLPALYSTEETKDPIVYTKLFHPLGNATWLLTEYESETKMAFGLAYIHEVELGYISIEELEEVVILGLKVERDMSFKPKPLSQARKESGL